MEPKSMNTFVKEHFDLLKETKAHKKKDKRRQRNKYFESITYLYFSFTFYLSDHLSNKMKNDEFKFSEIHAKTPRYTGWPVYPT